MDGDYRRDFRGSHGHSNRARRPIVNGASMKKTVPVHAGFALLLTREADHITITLPPHQDSIRLTTQQTRDLIWDLQSLLPVYPRRPFNEGS